MSINQLVCHFPNLDPHERKWQWVRGNVGNKQQNRHKFVLQENRVLLLERLGSRINMCITGEGASLKQKEA